MTLLDAAREALRYLRTLDHDAVCNGVHAPDGTCEGTHLSWRIEGALLDAIEEEERRAGEADESVAPRGFVDIVFDGPPSHESGRFVEVEDAERRSICLGEWLNRDDGFWALRIPDPRPTTAQEVSDG